MIALRFARPEDAAALLEIYRPYVEETAISFETEAPSREEFSDRIVKISERYPYLVAEEDGALLGYAYAHEFGERAAFRWTAETSIYVRRDARGRHVGKRLYDALLLLLAAQGVKTACAIITSPNEASFAFHHALGFQDGGRLPDFGYKLRQWRGVDYLYLRLDPSMEEPEPLRSVHDLDPALVQKILETDLRK